MTIKTSINARVLSAVAAALLLASCAAGALYHPATSDRSSGYREVLLEPGRYRVVFTGTTSTPASVVQDYALLRAAELTLNMGYTWFRVVARDTVEQDDGRGRPTIIHTPACGVYGCRAGIYGGILLADYYDDDRITASLEILMGKGEKPDDPDVYDAQNVANTIRSRMN